MASAEQAKEVIAANNVVIFGFFPDQGSDKAVTFLNTAGLVDDQIFAVVTDEKVIEELEAQPEDVILYKNVSTHKFIKKIVHFNF